MLFGDDALAASDAPSTGGEIARELGEERRHPGVVHGARRGARDAHCGETRANARDGDGVAARPRFDAYVSILNHRARRRAHGGVGLVPH